MHAIVIASLVAGACTQSTSRPDPIAVGRTPQTASPSFETRSGWQLVMEDEFVDEVDPDRWNTCHWWADGDGCQIAGNNELQWYRPEQVRVRNGALRLVAERRVAGDHSFVSGMVQSGPDRQDGESKFSFRYGAVEARVRLPAGPGLWPAVWLLPESTRSRPEIDIVELYGDEPDVMRMHFHWTASDGSPQQRGHLSSGVDLTTGWHTVGLRWEPGELIWYLDGIERWTLDRDEVPSEPMYPVINLAVGGDRAGTPGPEVRFPAEMSVDWVRVWQLA